MEPITPSSPNPEPDSPAASSNPQIGPTVFGPASLPAESMSAAPPAGPETRPLGVVLPHQAGAIINGEMINTAPETNFNQPGLIVPKKNRLRRFKRKAILVPILAFFVLLGGGAAAYFGYYVPNKPQNVLRQAIENSLTEHQATSTGTVDVTSSGVSGHVDYTAKIDSDSHAVDLNLNTTISGVKIPLELISAKGNLYFKLGDLSSLEGLLGQFIDGSDPNVKALEDKVNKDVTNQWIEVDSTLIKEAKLDCLTDYPAPLNQADIRALENSYKQKAFASITSHSTDSVNGASAYKYQLSINDNTLAGFDLNGAGYFKNINACLKKSDPGAAFSLNSLKDGDKTPITIWVDKKTKHIIKYASQSTSKDKASGTEGNVSGTLTYGNVNITQPANAKPVLSLLNDFGLSDLLNTFGASLSNPQTADSQRKTDINLLQAQLEAYQAQNGYYPTLAGLNDPQWRARNFAGLDGTSLKDPAGTSSTLSAKPAKGSYSYAVTPAGCDNGTHGNCNSYTLTATLDNGSTYVKQALNSDSIPTTVN